MKRKNNGGRSRDLLHFPGSDFNFTMEELVEIIDPSTNRITGTTRLRDLLEKFG